MSNKKLSLAVTFITIVLSIRLFVAADQFTMWREFLISEFVVLFSALSLLRLLRI